jgi:hypothetical protein
MGDAYAYCKGCHRESARRMSVSCRVGRATGVVGRRWPSPAAGRKRRAAPGRGTERRTQKTPLARPIRRHHHQAMADLIHERDRPSIRREARPLRMATQQHVSADRPCDAGRRRNQHSGPQNPRLSGLAPRLSGVGVPTLGESSS